MTASDDASGVFDAFSPLGLPPGLWEIDPVRSTASLRVRTWFGRVLRAELGPPAGEIVVDFAAGAPSRGTVTIPLTVGRGSRRLRRLLDTVVPDAISDRTARLRLHAATPTGTGVWSGAAVLTFAVLSDHVTVELRHVHDATGAALAVTTSFRPHDFWLDGSAARGGGGRLRGRGALRLRLSLVRASYG